MDSARTPPLIAVVLKGYPRLSETFIAQEIHALEARGVPLVLFSLRHPTDRKTHPIHAAIRAPVTYLPEYLHDDWPRVIAAWRVVRRRPGYAQALSTWRRDLARDPTPNRVRRFGQALVLAAELPEGVLHLHAHFLHTPASVTRYAALICGLRWSVSAHAKDVWTTPAWEKREKLASAAWATTCTAANATHLRAVAGHGTAIDLVYHGIDTARFPPPDARPGSRDGRDPADPVRLLTVGRAVDKKGLDDLLHALARLPPALCWRWAHIGGGPLAEPLARLAGELGLADRIEWRGAQAHAAVLEAYRWADLFVLPCRISDNGDRDGLPNVLLEAQSQRLACLSSDISGVRELIRHDVTGYLVPPRDPAALARAIATLVADPSLRRQLAEAGYGRTTAAFTLGAGVDRLRERLLAHA